MFTLNMTLKCSEMFNMVIKKSQSFFKINSQIFSCL